MRIVVFILLAFIFFATISFSQNHFVDSLKNELQKAKNDTAILEILNNISIAWQSKSEFDSALKYATDTKTLCEKLLKENQGSEQAAAISGELGRALVSIGVIATYTGNYTEGLKNQLAALKIFEQTNNTRAIASCYLNIGSLYFYQGNNDEALKNYIAASKIYEVVRDNYHLAMAYNNIGGIYINRLNYEEALKNLSASLEISQQIGDESGMANNYNNIGEVYSKQGNYTEALKSHLATLKIRESLADQRGIIVSYVNIGSDYTALGKYDEAVSYLDKAFKMGSEMNVKEVLKDIYLSYSEVYKKLNDFNNAYKYLTLYNALKDSLANETTGSQMAEMKTKYETEKKDEEISLLNKDKEIQAMKIEEQRTTGKYLIIGFALLVIFSTIAFRLYEQKKKTLFDRRVSETELKALRSQMNPHFTFNVLNSIQYYVSENDLESVELYLEKFSSLIRMILDQSRTAYISLDQEIAMLKLYMELEEMRFEKKFKYTIDVDPNLNPGKILLPGMLIQPMIENAIKHGIEHKEGEAVISVSFSAKNSTLICHVTDNGIGRAEAEKLKPETGHKSAATSIIKERMEALGSIYNIKLAYTMEDLYNTGGEPAGTLVSIEIPFLNDKT